VHEFGRRMVNCATISAVHALDERMGTSVQPYRGSSSPAKQKYGGWSAVVDGKVMVGFSFTFIIPASAPLLHLPAAALRASLE
jgi:hypothetical protein